MKKKQLRFQINLSNIKTTTTSENKRVWGNIYILTLNKSLKFVNYATLTCFVIALWLVFRYLSSQKRELLNFKLYWTWVEVLILIFAGSFWNFKPSIIALKLITATVITKSGTTFHPFSENGFTFVLWNQTVRSVVHFLGFFYLPYHIVVVVLYQLKKLFPSSKCNTHYVWPTTDNLQLT